MENNEFLKNINNIISQLQNEKNSEEKEKIIIDLYAYIENVNKKYPNILYDSFLKDDDIKKMVLNYKYDAIKSFNMDFKNNFKYTVNLANMVQLNLLLEVFKKNNVDNIYSKNGTIIIIKNFFSELFPEYKSFVNSYLKSNVLFTDKNLMVFSSTLNKGVITINTKEINEEVLLSLIGRITYEIQCNIRNDNMYSRYKSGVSDVVPRTMELVGYAHLVEHNLISEDNDVLKNHLDKSLDSACKFVDKMYMYQDLLKKNYHINKAYFKLNDKVNRLYANVLALYYYDKFTSDPESVKRELLDFMNSQHFDDLKYMINNYGLNEDEVAKGLYLKKYF